MPTVSFGREALLHYMNSLDKQHLSQHTLSIYILFQFQNGLTSSQPPLKHRDEELLNASQMEERAFNSSLQDLCEFVAFCLSALRGFGKHTKKYAVCVKQTTGLMQKELLPIKLP